MDQSTALTLECGGAAGFSETEGRVNELEVVKPKTAKMRSIKMVSLPNIPQMAPQTGPDGSQIWRLVEY